MEKINCPYCGKIMYSSTDLDKATNKTCIYCHKNLERVVKVKDSHNNEFYAEKIKVGNLTFYKNLDTLYFENNIVEINKDK